MIEVVGYWMVVTALTLPLPVVILYAAISKACNTIARAHGRCKVPKMLNSIDQTFDRFFNVDFSIWVIAYVIIAAMQAVLLFLGVIETFVDKADPAYSTVVINLVSKTAELTSGVIGYLIFPIAAIAGYFLLLRLWVFAIGVSIKIEKMEKRK